MRTPVDRVKAETEQLLKAAKCTTPPVDVEAIASFLGAQVVYEPFTEDMSGVLVKERKAIVIGVNSTHARTRQRFTIAHECGHLCLNHSGEIFVDRTMRSQSMIKKRDARSSLAIDRDEIEANRFAAELLMPERLLVAELRRSSERDYSGDLVSALAKTFQVSAQAMEYRLTNLGLFIPH